MPSTPHHWQATWPVDLGPEVPNPLSFQSISILLHANTYLIAPQCSYAYLLSFLTQRLIVCTPVPCSHPHLLHPHVDSCHSYRYSPASVLIAYMSLKPCVSGFTQSNTHQTMTNRSLILCLSLGKHWPIPPADPNA